MGRPQLVAEVAYAERTNDGILRQASFMGLREDLPAKKCTRSARRRRPRHRRERGNPRVLGVKITPPGPPDLAEARDQEARPGALHRGGRRLAAAAREEPAAVAGALSRRRRRQCFYQRHPRMAASPGGLQTVKRERSSKGAYIYAASLEALLSAVQNGAVEFHTWGATVRTSGSPDRITMDLDPDPDAAWKTLVEGDAAHQDPARRVSD